jgi:hypothetical protein
MHQIRSETQPQHGFTKKNILLGTYFHQRIFITLEKMQTLSTLSQVVVISLTIFQLFLVQDPPLIPIVNLLQTIDK